MASDWLIDLGHTRLKWARWAAGGELADWGSAPADAPEPFFETLTSDHEHRLWASAQGNSADIARIGQLAGQVGACLETIQTGQVRLAVMPAYPQLGCDRWLALQWPWRCSGSPVCVVDCGTALTIDVVDGSGRHRGGWIMAGPEQARAALLGRADRLPREAVEVEDPDQPATDSAQALSSGAILQAAAVIERGADAASRLVEENPEIWITGGGAAAIMPHLRLTTRFDELLVLRGLAMVLETIHSR